MAFTRREAIALLTAAPMTVHAWGEEAEGSAPWSRWTRLVAAWEEAHVLA